MVFYGLIPIHPGIKRLSPAGKDRRKDGGQIPPDHFEVMKTECRLMKRWTAALLALAMLLACGALAECEGWAIANVDSEIRETPDPEGEVILEVPEGTELEYGGFTKYDEKHEPWYGVSTDDVTGWIPGSDAELMWSTLY